MIQIILLVLILFIIFAIYKKLSNIDMQVISNNKLNKLDKIYLALKKINKDIKQKVKNTKNQLKLKTFNTDMMRFREFLNQSKFFKKIDVIDSLYMIDTKAGSVEDNKLFFLAEFTKLIFSNGLTFKDFDIETDYYGFAPSHIDYISFDIENVNKIRDGIDYKIYECDVVFTLKDKTKKSLKYEFYNNRIDEFKEDYKKFKFVNYSGYTEKCLYFNSYETDKKYRIILNDLFQYLEFVGKEFYNKNFIRRKLLSNLSYEYEIFLIDGARYEDLNWQINKNDFIYVDEIDKIKEINVIDNNISDDELFIYTLNLYYKEYNSIKHKDNIFKVIKYLDILIEKEYGMAYIVKAILHIDGKIVLKDYNEAKILLRKAYNLGFYTPSMLVWNENKLYKRGEL
ncbi:hypothetical protein [Sulfurimonas sp.]